MGNRYHVLSTRFNLRKTCIIIAVYQTAIYARYRYIQNKKRRIQTVRLAVSLKSKQPFQYELVIYHQGRTYEFKVSHFHVRTIYMSINWHASNFTALYRHLCRCLCIVGRNISYMPISHHKANNVPSRSVIFWHHNTMYWGKNIALVSHLTTRC